jgi:hypothetical protein
VEVHKSCATSAARGKRVAKSRRGARRTGGQPRHCWSWIVGLRERGEEGRGKGSGWEILPS